MSTYFPISKTAILEGNVVIASKKTKKHFHGKCSYKDYKCLLTDQLCFPFSGGPEKLGKECSAQGDLVTPQGDECAGESSAEASQLLLYAAVKLTRCSGIRKGAHYSACPSVYPLPYVHISHKRCIFRVQLLKAYMLIFLQIYYV